MRAAVLGLAAALSAGGCNAILGLGDVKAGSGAPDAQPDAKAQPDAPPAPMCPTATSGQVVGCYVISHVTADGNKTDVAEDLSKLTITARVLSGTTFGAPITAQVTGPGAFTLAIPDGATFYLRIDDPRPNVAPRVFVTKQRNLDLGFVTIGRVGATPVTMDTTVALDLTGMTAWQAPDYLLVDSFNSGTENFVAPTSNPPTVGATATTAQFNWNKSYTFGADGAPPKLLSAAAGDDVWITHNTSRVITDPQGYAWTAQWIADKYETSAVTMIDGQQLTIPTPSAAFTQIPATLTQSFSIDISGLRAEIPDAGRYANEEWSCGEWINPASGAGIGMGPSTIGFDATTVPSGEDNVSLTGLKYGDPYPSSWPRLMFCNLRHARRLMMPGATTPLYTGSFYGLVDVAVPNFSFAAPFQSGHGPANLKIAGVAVQNGAAVPFDGTSALTISWDPVVNADSYSVEVFHGGVDLGNSISTQLATFFTSSSSLVLPPEMFTPGDMYGFYVGEVSLATPQYGAGHLQRSSAPQTWGRSMTGFVRFSNKCGNHNVDTGEDCDTGGDSATCDADCSTAICGDGYINAAAGEQCDEINDTPTCNAATCKTSACGDGYRNRLAGEQCDDGNTSDGDGCNHLCQLEHCGDGTLNTPLEGCDDGNKVDGDGCNAFCRVEPGWSCTPASPSVCTRM